MLRRVIILLEKDDAGRSRRNSREGVPMKTYLIDIYIEGTQWRGFGDADSLTAAHKYVLDRYPDAKAFGAHNRPYHQDLADETAENGTAKCIEKWVIDSTDYADIYEITPPEEA